MKCSALAGKIVVTILAAACTLVSANSQTMKVGVIDSEVIVQQLPETKQADEQLTALSQKYQDTLLSMKNELETRLQKYQQQQAMLTPEAKAKEEESLRALNQQMLAYEQQKRIEIGQIREELLAPIRDKIEKAISDVAKEEKLMLVLDKAGPTLRYFDDSLNITWKVMDKISTLKSE